MAGSPSRLGGGGLGGYKYPLSAKICSDNEVPHLFGRMVFRRRVVRRKAIRRPMRRFTRTRMRANRFRRRHDAGTSTLNTAPHSAFAVRMRRKSRRAYRNALWRDSEMKAKYGSLLSTNSAINTPATILGKLIFAQGMYKLTGNAFWVALGGAYTRDAFSLPAFDSNSIFLRGGKAQVRVTNPATNAQPVEIEVGVLMTRANPNLTPVATSTVDRSWDFRTASTSWETGKLLSWKKVMLKPGESALFEHKFRSQKIKAAEYINGGLTPTWLCSLANLNGVAAQGLNWTFSYNLSFVGDADTAP